MFENLYLSLHKVLLFLSYLNETFIFSIDFRRITQKQIPWLSSKYNFPKNALVYNKTLI
jgi:hypothetical protein